MTNRYYNVLVNPEERSMSDQAAAKEPFCRPLAKPYRQYLPKGDMFLMVALVVAVVGILLIAVWGPIFGITK
jgi:hypothetical protein